MTRDEAGELYRLLREAESLMQSGFQPKGLRQLLDEAASAVLSLSDECHRLRSALHEISEEWAGSECGEPVHAQEAYAIGLAKRMYALAVEGMS